MLIDCKQLGYQSIVKKKEKKNYGPFLWMGFNCLKATATLRRQFTFYHSVPRNSWCSFYWPRKDKRLSRPWSHPVVLSTTHLDWEFSTLTTRPLLHKLNLHKLNLHKLCHAENKLYLVRFDKYILNQLFLGIF